ncbi:hypothetical protein RGQ29_024313 [Quercus rubra]|uniref:Uncharacterized protein n=1 Tax=Quercus rubra TaxID=3512 RepID=A0AAN7EVU9_QUERU|nr:hypothetical protein RGQ29_024313 [Quercus rubra]
MAAFIKLLCVFFFLSLVSEGNCQCSLSNVSVVQSKSELVVQQKPVWNATINLDCSCTLSDLVLGSKGFQTVLPLDSTIIVQSGNRLQVTANGGTISSNISFAYAWDTSFSFNPISGQPNCS